MLKIENCPKASASYLVERMVLNQNRDFDIVLEAPITTIEESSYSNNRTRVAQVRGTQFFLFASYVPLVLATSTSQEDNTGVVVLIACCVLAFFLFGGRRSNKIKD